VTALLDAEINRQAAMIAYINDFHLIMWLTILSLPVAFILRKPARKRAGDTPIVME
jgi:DHA2 family multidrug resistance protein